MRPIDILFVHNNFPAQFRNLAMKFARMPGVRVKAISSPPAPGLSDVDMHRYRMPDMRRNTAHPFAKRFDVECRRAEMVLYEAAQLKQAGFFPQVIYVHPGWGEALPLRNLFPDATLCTYSEFYYAPRGTDVGFDKEFDTFGVDGEVRISLRNASTLLALTDCDFSIAPTRWQYSVFPQEFRPKIHIVHDGLDFSKFALEPQRRATSIQGLDIAEEDEVITFVSRSLEPYRGFHIFMRALPDILAARPRARVLILGNDGVSYGAAPRQHASWRNYMLDELGQHIDFSRVHFMGWVDYASYMAVLRRSDAHVYLTYPFVLSWSMLEAMALECLVIGSDTPPVAEVITHEESGLLVPFFDRNALANQIIDVLAEPERYRAIRRRARETVTSRYDFEASCWPKHVELLREYCYSRHVLNLLDKPVKTPASPRRHR
ncbi:MAG: glycosyltransferase [Proteobacteria bacterium]|nr:glycosyltransferase [Pseudomonadota bacterium]